MTNDEKLAAIAVAEEALNRSNALDALRALLPLIRHGHENAPLGDVTINPDVVTAPTNASKQMLVEDESNLKDDIAYLGEKAAEAKASGDTEAEAKANKQAQLLKSAESIVENTTATKKRTPTK